MNGADLYDLIREEDHVYILNRKTIHLGPGWRLVPKKGRPPLRS